MWDFGGQEEFYVLHHLYLTRFAAYAVVFDMRVGRYGPSRVTKWEGPHDLACKRPRGFIPRASSKCKVLRCTDICRRCP